MTSRSPLDSASQGASPSDRPRVAAESAGASSVAAGAENSVGDPAGILRWLVGLHYGLAIFTLLGILPFIPLVQVGYEVMYAEGSEALSPESSRWVSWFSQLAPEADLPLLGAILIMAGASVIVLSAAHGVVLAYVGRCLARRRRYLLCVIFSILNLTHVPLGTMLSIFTLVMLFRPECRALFPGGGATAAPAT